MIIATRHQDIDTGHRVKGQGGQCEHLHGHTYRVHFYCAADKLNEIGMVLDFGVIKTLLCEWLLRNWDHKFLIFSEDPVKTVLVQNDPAGVIVVPFNPTAERMAEYLLNMVGPEQLAGTGVRLIKVVVEETRKCSASAEL